MLLERVKNSHYYVVLFDESLNKTTQEKQLDVYARYWNEGLVITRFLSAEFLGHATADDVLAKLLSSLDGLNRTMDGPLVNWKVFDTLQQRLKTDADVTLLNIGSCSLHQVHGAFKFGADTAGWDVESSCPVFINCLKTLQQDGKIMLQPLKVVSFRRSFVRIVGLKMCQNITGCRGLSTRQGVPWLQCLQKNSLIRKRSHMPFLQRQLKTHLCKPRCIFLSVATQLQPFLKTFQTDVPLGPFPAFRVIVDGQEPSGSICETQCVKFHQRHPENRLEEDRQLEQLHQG